MNQSFHWHVGTGIGAGNEDGDDYNVFTNPRDAVLHLLGNLNEQIEDAEADDDPAQAQETEEATQAHGELTEALPFFTNDGNVDLRRAKGRTAEILTELTKPDGKLDFEVGEYLTFWLHACTDPNSDGCGPDAS